MTSNFHLTYYLHSVSNDLNHYTEEGLRLSKLTDKECCDQLTISTNGTERGNLEIYGVYLLSLIAKYTGFKNLFKKLLDNCNKIWM